MKPKRTRPITLKHGSTGGAAAFSGCWHGWWDVWTEVDGDSPPSFASDLNWGLVLATLLGYHFKYATSRVGRAAPGAAPARELQQLIADFHLPDSRNVSFPELKPVHNTNSSH